MRPKARNLCLSLVNVINVSLHFFLLIKRFVASLLLLKTFVSVFTLSLSLPCGWRRLYFYLFFLLSLSVVSVYYENDLGGNFFEGKLVLVLRGERFAGVKSFSFLFFFFFFSSFWEIIAWCSWRCLIVFFTVIAVIAVWRRECPWISLNLLRQAK